VGVGVGVGVGAGVGVVEAPRLNNSIINTLQAGSQGDASLVHAKLGECEGEDEAENFIQDDNSGGDDDDEFGNEWALSAGMGGGAGVLRPASGVRRPDSAAHRKNHDMNLPRPPCPTMDRFRVPLSGLDPAEAKLLRLDSIWPSFVEAYHPIVSRKYAVGASKMLLQYLQRGYPEYCVQVYMHIYLYMYIYA